MNSQLTPGLNDIFAYIDEHAEMFLQRLIEYLRRPSISAYGEGIGEVADYIAGVMRQMGLAVRVMPTDGWPMVFGEYHARPADRNRTLERGGLPREVSPVSGIRREGFAGTGEEKLTKGVK